jgi:hypothetical protein
MGYKLRRLLIVMACCVVALLPMACTLRSAKNPTTLSYKMPTTVTVPVGSLLPGTNLRYIGMHGEDANVLIGNQVAHKRRGDSLNWNGSPLDGVSVDLKLRIVWFTETELHLVGTAKIVINNVAPQATSALTESEVKYSGAVAYSLAKGAVIPGTTLTYEGQFDEGAKLGGVPDYPYRENGDSVVWEGMLRQGVYVRFNLRVAQFDSRAMRVVGTISLWLG